MFRSKPFVYITLAEFIIRSAYQMGKIPLLPIFAASLGAGPALLGFIVSVSTLTGMMLKPFFGFLSDRWGRKVWLIVGTTFFVVIPFMYQFVNTTEALFAIRMIHGLATAIYGPVTLAYVAELSSEGRAERLAWFSNARSAGYIVGPVIGGLMLLSMDPRWVFTVVGLMSSVAFIPVLLLPEIHFGSTKKRPPIAKHAMEALWTGGRNGAVLLAGGAKGKRQALPNARVLLHQPMGGIGGQAADMEIHAREIIKMRQQINEVLVECTEQPIERIERDTERDFFMSAEQAVEYGILDEIIAPSQVEVAAAVGG